MSVQTEITRIKNEVNTQANLIEQISTALTNKAAGGGGITPTGTIEITENGEYDVTEYASATVTVENVGSDSTIEDGLISGTLTGEYVNNRVTTMSQYALYQQYSVEKLVLNSISSVSVYGVGHCTNLRYAEFASATNIAAAAFLMCYRLTALVLRNTSVVTLANTNAFGSCYHLIGTQNSTYNPNGLKDCYIYVPKALVETYKAATNWVTYESQFRALEDYTVDGTISGKLDESKI